MLILSGTQVTDAGLVHLQGLKKLGGLILTDTQITDAGLVHLQRLESLSALRLDETKVTDAGLALFKGNIEELWLNRTRKY